MPQGELHQVNVPDAGYYAGPDINSGLETEVLFGERVWVIGERQGDFLPVRSELYSSPGFVRVSALRASYVEPTSRIIVPAANFYVRPTFKSAARGELAMNALVHITGLQETPEGMMVRLDGLGWVFENQLIAISTYLKDYVKIARLYVGGSSAYTWGSRTKPDCSALVMAVSLACGISCRRNVGEQVTQLGKSVDFLPDYSDLKKGDFVFWTSEKGRHVAIMSDARHCIHATIAWPHRCTVEQLLAEVISDQQRDGNGRPTHVRRFEGYRFD